jgi:hypothetical protein
VLTKASLVDLTLSNFNFWRGGVNDVPSLANNPLIFNAIPFFTTNTLTSIPRHCENGAGKV